MDPITQQTVLACAGAGGAGSATYVDDVFSTFLLTGNGSSSRSIQNGLDLSGEGGLVWFKARDQSYDNALFDTERGTNQRLNSNAAGASQTETTTVTAFNSDGFTVGSNVYVNGSGTDYVSWTFRKCPGFFDIVTYTGNGSNRAIAHNLGSKPGFIIIKSQDSSSYWRTYNQARGATKSIVLNEDFAENDFDQIFNDTEPTSTHFTVGTHDTVNKNGDEFVAYLFAHDDQSFGTNSDEAIIKCGSFSGGNSPNNFVDLGFEPQFLITRQYDDTANWEIADIMRGAGAQSGLNEGKRLFANTNGSEQGYNRFSPTPTGFFHHVSGSTSDNFIYIAIRRPNKPPEAGTDVFDPRTASSFALNSNIPCNFAPDFMIATARTATLTNYAEARLTDNWLNTSSSGAEDTTNYFKWDGEGGKINLPTSAFGNDPVIWQFRRAPGFFDVATFTSNSSGATTVNHNLGVAPEILVVKKRDTTGEWETYTAALGNTKYLRLDNSNAAGGPSTPHWNSTSPTATQFTVGTEFNGTSCVAYLFASLAGISKVGTYTGTGSNVNVDCGFTSGARFVLIKRTDSSGDWYVWDTARGIVAGNDPYLLLNSSAVEVTSTDYIDPLNSGFTVTSSAPAALNTSGGTYLFLAIA